jgi:hypothetical protein
LGSLGTLLRTEELSTQLRGALLLWLLLRTEELGTQLGQNHQQHTRQVDGIS